MAIAFITRAEAQAQGLKRYFTGEPCQRGHVAERQTSNLTCMECTRLKARQAYPNRDREAERQRLRRWVKANREKVNAASRAANERPETKARRAAWFQANKDRIRENRRKQYAENPEKRLAGNRRWIEANPDRFAEHMRMHARKRRAQKHKSNGTHTAADLAEILAAQDNRCAYCRADLRRTKKHVDHIVPLARGGSNGRSNLQYLCQPCNQAKNWKDPIDFAQSVGLLL